MMKDLERDGSCPLKFYHKWVKRSFKMKSSEAMDRGKYFEYLALGGGATEDEVTDLRIDPKAKKSTVQIRIEEQAERFKQMFTPGSKTWNGHTITDTQILLEGKSTMGTADFLTVDEDGLEYLWDLKLTADINANPSFNPYSWRDAHRIDFTQQIYYDMLWEAVKGCRIPSRVIVFDYTPAKNVKLFKLDDISKDARNTVIERATLALEVIASLDEKAEVIPSKDECKDCKVKCKAKIGKEHVQIETISL